MASSTILVRRIINPLSLSSFLARSRSLHISSASTNVINGGAFKFTGTFSKPGRSPVVARLFNTTPARDPGDSKALDHLRDMFKSFDFIKNPYLMEGPEKFCNVEENKDALYARLDMPGIAKKGLKLWVSSGSLCISGDECASRALYQLENDRLYSTNIAVPSEMYRTDQIRALLKNGVLRVVVPKVKNGERTGSAHITVEDLPDQCLPFVPISGRATTPGQGCQRCLTRSMTQYADSAYQRLQNPFLVIGPQAPFNFSSVDEIQYIRVDMPGVGRDGVKLWIHDNSWWFQGLEGEKDLSYLIKKKKKGLSYDKETGRRMYQGCLGLAEMFPSDAITACFENGVLRVSLPGCEEDFF